MRAWRSGWGILCTAAIAVACGGSAGPADASGGATASPKTPKTGDGATGQATPEPERPLTFDTHAYKFSVIRPEDQRKLLLEADVPVPRGWAIDPNANPVVTTHFSGETPVSTVAISATCFGTCTAALAEANLLGAAKLVAAGYPGATVARDDKLTPPPGVDGIPGARMRGFVVDLADGGHVVGVALQPEAETGLVLACQATLRGALASQTQAFWDACAKVKVRIVDPNLQIDQLRLERDNLARCPTAAKLTIATPAPGTPGTPPPSPAPGTPVPIQKVVVVATRAGLIEVYLGSDALTSVRAEPAAGQQRVQLTFDAGTHGGEVLSGILPAKGGAVRIDATLQTGPSAVPLVRDQLTGSVEIIARTRTEVCGTFTISDSVHTIDGAFPATPILIGNAP